MSTDTFPCPVPPVRGVHYADGRLQNRPIVIHLVGCGGTGSQVLTGLARIHLGLRALGHPFGLDVHAFDPDTVSRANVGRQLFSPADVGAPKAATLITRLNCFFGLSWAAYTNRYDGTQGNLNRHSAGDADFIITCVDTAAARRAIAENMLNIRKAPYWLDCGNSRQRGQVFLTQGHPDTSNKPVPFVDRETVDALGIPNGGTPGVGLPTLWEVLPEIFDENEPEDDTPSCSLAEALGEQDLFINQAVATQAVQLLWTLLREGKIKNHGFWINLADGMVLPVPVTVPAPESTEGATQARVKVGTNG